MKQLLLVRHAKSDWGDPSLSDFDRPLNDRGKRDAPIMAHRVLDRKIKIDAFISSPAKRAARTAKIFLEEMGAKKKKLEFKGELYLASPQVFYEVISAVDDEHDTIAVFSHNEGITDFANQLTDTKIDNIPTSAVFAIKIDTDNWKNFREAKKEFWFFDYPKAGTVN
jgi:phosphohistidine phosphatase